VRVAAVSRPRRRPVISAVEIRPHLAVSQEYVRTFVRLLLPSPLMDLRRSRIHEAQRAGLRNRIRDDWHVPEEKTDALLEAWPVEANGRGVEPGQSAYWRDGEAWIRAKIDRAVR
jgi:hypothetical protein